MAEPEDRDDEEMMMTSDDTEAIRKHRIAATVLAHGLAGDRFDNVASWGMQEAAIEAGAPDAFIPMLTYWLEMTRLLRRHLPDDVRENLVDQLRREIASAAAALEDGDQ
ncbi:hypothetical protein [Mycobacterium simulans]|uniref:hypothetical protein n=1 Tax=Mycobacterium simulans TaxID=627089 RepID=UPI00174E65FB|nr:hypothetical protein [Mycobacterium simulans]